MWKKVFAILLISILLLTGCGKDKETNDDKDKNDIKENTGMITCTKSETDENNLKTESTMTVNYKKGIVTKVEETSTQEVDETMIELTLLVGNGLAEKLNAVDGISSSFSKEGSNQIKSVMSVDYEKLNVEDLKTSLGEMFNEDTFYSSKDLTLEDFKAKNLSGYECK